MFMLLENGSRFRAEKEPTSATTQNASHPVTQYPIPNTILWIKSNRSQRSKFPARFQGPQALFPFYLSVLYLFSYRNPCPEALLRITYPVSPSLLCNINLPNLTVHKILPSLWKRNVHRNSRPFLAWYVLLKIVST